MVTYAHMTLKATLFGSSYGLAEEWTTSFWIGNTVDGDYAQDPTLAQATAVAAAWQTFFTATNTGVNTMTKTEGCKLVQVGTDGKAIDGTTQFYYYPTPITGAQSGSSFPPQIALVGTLTSAKARGFGSKGRMYLPGINHLVTGDGRMSTTNAGFIAANFKTFINAVNAISWSGDDGGHVVLNAAAKTTAPTHAAAMFPVTGIRVGNVYDTQRRRRNQLQEQYSTLSLA